MPNQSLTLKEFAARYRISHSSALELVYQGYVRAIDVSANPKGRSRYIIPMDAVEEFERARATNYHQPVTRTTRRRKAKQVGVIEFIS